MLRYKENPWNELNPYSEGQPIYGRNQIITKLVDAIYTNLQTILYGKSGIGKTSLLQAGCFPELRKRHFFPIIIRPGIMESSNDYAKTVKDMIYDSAKEEIPGLKPSLHPVTVGGGFFTENLLCQFLFSTKFVDDRGDIYIPILIFDQFEELLNNKRIYASAVSFVKDLYVLLDNTISIPAGFLDYSNYRLVFAIREDFLYCLEDIVDHYNLDELRYNRYRITALTDKQAKSVIEKTFRSVIEDFPSDNLNRIADVIIPIAKGQNEDADIQTPILSLLGSLMFKQIAAGCEIDTINTGNELYLYYDEIMSEPNIPLSVRWFLEQKLITVDGRRDSMDYQSALLTNQINENQINYLVKKKRILRIVDAGTGERRLEFSHDTICKALRPVIEMRNGFYQKGYELNNSSFDKKELQPDIVRYLSYASELGHLDARHLLKNVYKDNLIGVQEDIAYKASHEKMDRLAILLNGGEWAIPILQVSKKDENKYDVFLSYSRKNFEDVRQIQQELQSIGCRVWMDTEGIMSGDNFVGVIVKAIESSSIFIFVASENIYKSSWCMKELQYAENKGRTIIIVKIDNSEMPDEFALLYGDRNFIDYRNNNQKAKLFTDLKRKFSGISIRDKETGLEYIKIMVHDYQIVMMRVEGGLFTMGATLQQGGDNEDERIVHNVQLDSFYISQLTVTRKLWVTVMGKKIGMPQSTNDNSNSYPIVNVSWYECLEFIERLNALTGKEFRLPTEAEWEYAAKGGINGRMNGYKYSGGNNLHNISWNAENSSGQIHKVAQKKPNELGIYDMSGNVWEWCSDWYAPYPKGQADNPTGPDIGEKKVCRGGSWSTKGRDCRISIRESEYPYEGSLDIGFRLVL